MIKEIKKYDYKNLLNKLTKKQLDDIRRKLRIKGVSKLKKDELIDVIVKEMESSLEDLFRRYIYLNEYKCIEKLIKNKGHLEITDIDNEHESISLLKELGIAFEIELNHNQFVVVPEQIIFIIKKLLLDKSFYNEMLERNKYVQYVRGILYYYGVMDIECLYQKVNSLCFNKIEKDKFTMFISDYVDVYNDIKADGNVIYHFNVKDAYAIYFKQNMSLYIDYYNITLSEILKAGKENHVEFNNYENTLYNKFISDYGMEMDEAHDFVCEIIFDIKNDIKINEIINKISRKIKFKNIMQINEITKLTKDVNNNCRMWILKGNTPSEIYEKEKNNLQPLNNNKKIGRNEPCPCGSGKKYKKCCGRA